MIFLSGEVVGRLCQASRDLKALASFVTSSFFTVFTATSASLNEGSCAGFLKFIRILYVHWCSPHIVKRIRVSQNMVQKIQ